MDGYGGFVETVAIGAFAVAMLAGAIVRNHAIGVIGVTIGVTFLGVFAYLFAAAGGTSAAGIAAMTTSFVVPLIAIAALLGKGAANLMNRKL